MFFKEFPGEQIAEEQEWVDARERFKTLEDGASITVRLKLVRAVYKERAAAEAAEQARRRRGRKRPPKPLPVELPPPPKLETDTRCDCGRQRRFIIDGVPLCKRCAHERGQRPHGKIT